MYLIIFLLHQFYYFLNNYKYSSYVDYLEIDRFESTILNREAFPDYFLHKEMFVKEIFEWLSFGDQEI